MHAVLTNQITDIWHFNDNISKANYFLISSYGNVVGFELFLWTQLRKKFHLKSTLPIFVFLSFVCFAFLVFLYNFILQKFRFTMAICKVQSNKA